MTSAQALIAAKMLTWKIKRLNVNGCWKTALPKRRWM